jgi:hypothetical protein
MRLLPLFLLLPGFVLPARAQQAASIQPHPADADEILITRPADDLLIYRAGDAVRFVSDGTTRSVVPRGPVIGHAENADAVALFVKSPGSDSLRVSVFRSDGVRRFESMLPHHPDDPRPRAALSDRGETALVRPETARLVLLQADGALRRDIPLFNDAPHSLERNVLAAFAPGGQLLAVAAQREALHPHLADAEANAYLFLFDPNGALLRRLPLPQPAVRALAISPEGVIAVSTYDSRSIPIRQHTRVFTSGGAELLDVPEGADRIHFSSDAVLLVQTRAAAAFGLADGVRRFDFRAEPGRQILAATAGATGYAFVTGTAVFEPGGFTFGDLRLAEVDESGDVSPLQEMGGRAAHIPTVHILPADGATAVTLDAETRIFAPRR